MKTYFYIVKYGKDVFHITTSYPATESKLAQLCYFNVNNVFNIQILSAKVN
jgi:hypothetical protein